jgi:hypothetical protein
MWAGNLFKETRRKCFYNYCCLALITMDWSYFVAFCCVNHYRYLWHTCAETCRPRQQTLLLLLRALQSIINFGHFYDCQQTLKSFSTVKAFYGEGPSTPLLTPNLKGQGIPFCLDNHLWPVRHERLYQQLLYRRHSSQDHMTTQAPPPLHESRDTYLQHTLPAGNSVLLTENKINIIYNEFILYIGISVLFY